MPNPFARCATSWPIRPKPRIPSVFSYSSTPGELRALPRPAGQRRVRLRDVAREREQQRHRVLGGRDHVRLRRVGDDDPAFGRRRRRRRCRPRRRRARRPAAGRRRSSSSASSFVAERIRIPSNSPEPLRRAAHATSRSRARRRSARVSSSMPDVADLLGDEHPGRSAVTFSVTHPDALRTQSMQAVSARTSAGSVAGNIATRSWLRRACGRARRRRSRWRAASPRAPPRRPRRRNRSCRRPASASRGRRRTGSRAGGHRPSRRDARRTRCVRATIASRPPASSIHASWSASRNSVAIAGVL